LAKLFLFFDGSAAPITNIGCGAYFFIDAESIDLKVDPSLIKTRFFKDTSSTRLELETLLWALEENDFSSSNLTVFTDSQNIVGLPDRRKRLENNGFLNRKGLPLKNGDLYLRFFKLQDQLNFSLVKVKGHVVSREKSMIDRLFSVVDKASREALRRLGQV
jgi:ribonuclease HI